MNNLIVKLEDFELDEISGGVTAKQVAKKIGAYAIKGTFSFVLGSCTSIMLDLTGSIFDFDKGIRNFLSEKLKNKKVACTINSSICHSIPTALVAVGGWKLGEWLCKKIGLED